MTIKGLIEYLNQFPSDTPVCIDNIWMVPTPVSSAEYHKNYIVERTGTSDNMDVSEMHYGPMVVLNYY